MIISPFHWVKKYTAAFFKNATVFCLKRHGVLKKRGGLFKKDDGPLKKAEGLWDVSVSTITNNRWMGERKFSLSFHLGKFTFRKLRDVDRGESTVYILLWFSTHFLPSQIIEPLHLLFKAFSIRFNSYIIKVEEDRKALDTLAAIKKDVKSRIRMQDCIFC